MITKKDCSKCFENKPLEDFFRAEGYFTGRQSWCKACLRSYNAAAYQRKKDKGLCPQCNVTHNGEFINCDACRAKAKERIARNQDKPCIHCKKNPRIKSNDECYKCRAVYHKKRRTQVYEAYGGVRCNCCGEEEEMFLSIDHVNNDGAEHRRKKRMLGPDLVNWLIRNNYPSNFQILCRNCNYGKYLNGGTCPHLT